MHSLKSFASCLLAVGSLWFVSANAAAWQGSTSAIEVRRGCADTVEPGHQRYDELAPHYTIERRTYSVDKPPVLVLSLYVPTEEIYEAPMVGLACRLASEFPNETRIDALIFDDKKAARNLALGFTEQRHYGSYLWHLKARYELDRDKRREFIDFLLPDVQDRLLFLKRYRIWIVNKDRE